MMNAVMKNPRFRPAVIFLMICCFLMTSAAPAAATALPEAPSNPLKELYHDLLNYPIDRELRPCYFGTLLADLYRKNPDAREFCNRYLELRNEEPTANLSAYADCEGVPLFLQWDLQWGYFDYGGNLLGLSGCGPTCLSMVCPLNALTLWLLLSFWKHGNIYCQWL